MTTLARDYPSTYGQAIRFASSLRWLLNALMITEMFGKMVRLVIALPMLATGCHQASLPVPTGNVADCVVEEVGPIFAEDAKQFNHTFLVKNGTSQAVRVVDVGHSCACSDIVLEKMALEPGEQTRLHLKADLSGKRGPQRLSCHVELDSGQVLSYELMVTVQRRVAFDPEKLHLGLLDPDQPTVRVVRLVTCSPSGADLPQVVSLIPRSKSVDVAAADANVATNANGLVTQSRDVSLTVRPTVTTGTEACTIVARYWHAGCEHEALLSLSWNVRGYFHVSPARVFFWPRPANEFETSAHSPPEAN